MISESKDIVSEAKWHLSTLPPHAKARYSTDLIEQLVEEVERLRAEQPPELIWRTRSSEPEYLPQAEWIRRASDEIVRLRGVIDTYVSVCEAGAKEICALRSGRIIKVPDEMDE